MAFWIKYDFGGEYLEQPDIQQERGMNLNLICLEGHLPEKFESISINTDFSFGVG